MTRRRAAPPVFLALVAGIAGAAGTALGDPPPPLGSSLFAFPGERVSPSSSVSAGLALADRWLGDTPFGNPAVAGGSRAEGSGLVQRVSRQDLRAANRNLDDTPAFFDGAGAAVVLSAPARLVASLYACQPVLRRERVAFSRGTGTPDPALPPATIEADASARELRAGAACSAPVGPARVGVAVEWTHRRDAYEVVERSGSPEAGTTRLEFSGGAVGLQAGLRIGRGDPAVPGFQAGLAVRRIPRLAVEGTLRRDLLTGSSSAPVRAEREAGWELGSTLCYVTGASFRAFAALGARTAQRWEGFDLVAGRAWEWKLAAEYGGADDPLALRFGLGQERQDGAAEPSADVLGLGVGWRFAWGRVDAGLMHRGLARPGAPRSYGNRLVLTVGTRH